MKSSLEIAQDAVLKPIEEIAEEVGLEDEEFEPYGRYKAKIDLAVARPPAATRPTASSSASPA